MKDTWIDTDVRDMCSKAGQDCYVLPDDNIIDASLDKPLVDKDFKVYVKIASKAHSPKKLDGPFRVVSRSNKHFNVRKDGRDDIISIDRLKPFNGLSPHLGGKIQATRTLLNSTPLNIRAKRITKPPDRLSYSISKF